MDAFEPAATDVDPYPILIASFLDDLTVAGYAPHRLAARGALVQKFARWTQDRHVAVAALDAGHVTAFVAARSRGRETQKHERATLRRFVGFLRRRGVLATRPIPTAPLEILADDYVAHLRRDRGLADNSIAIYGPCARAFLAHCGATGGVGAVEMIDAEAIRAFLVARVAGRSSESARLLTVGLRSFLRFLVLRGVLTRDLSGAVPRVRMYQQASVPVVLSPDEIERAVATADRSTPRGRRDYAVLLLLARLGLRASEVMALELDDIHWRAAEIVVRGKGRRRDHVPLLTDVGDALTRYLREDRGTRPSRRVFLRLIPPRVGLSRPCAIDHIVRLALQRADIGPHRRRVAHLFRHSLATRMIRHGASLTEIAEVLRHRSQTTTALYAKVSFEALRSVAAVAGGGRCAMSALHAALGPYVEVRRALGSTLVEPASTLAQFVTFLEREGATHITTALALQWAMAPQGVQRATWARRLSMVRRFATWLHAQDLQTEVPPYGALPARRRRRRPHIFTDDEVRRLMAEAAHVRSRTGLRPLTYTTLIGLLAATGLRPGEALALDTTDVDLDGRLLTIRQSKFGKSRIVPVDDSTRDALRQYLTRRTALCPRPQSAALLLSEHGRRLRGNATRRMFAVVSCAIGLRPTRQRHRWGRGPRLQDLRHTFATRRLVEWYQADVDVARVLPTLATYLGHVGIGLTYWYIEAVPELLAHARTRLGSPRLPGGPR